MKLLIKAFSFIEVIFTLSIVAILVAVSYPSFNYILLKARRVDAQCSLMAFANAMERHYIQNNSYLGAGVLGANTGCPGVFSSKVPLGGGSADYELIISTSTFNTYTLMATPIGKQVLDKCGSLTLNELGVKGITNSGIGVVVKDCW